jgi:predicted PP-loop superfamily ATPase
MVMNLLRVVRRADPQYSADSFREAKCTRLGYKTRLSRLHTLDPPLALAFPGGSHSATWDPRQKNN